MSRVYAGGVKATAIANIKADLATYISFNAQGEKVVDVAGVESYLQTQFAAISTDAEYIAPATAASSLAAARAAPVRRMAEVLDEYIGVNHWKARADWPTTTSVLAGSAQVNAVKDAMAECQRRSDALTSYYGDINSRLAQYVDEFIAQGADARVTAGVVRRIETRSVICTYVSDRSEESAPSLPSELVDIDQNDTATYTAPTPPVDRNISTIRWYRSRSSNIASDFAHVADVTYNAADASTLSYTDSKEAEALGEPCPTITWAHPPSDLIGICAGTNGGMAAFKLNSNQVYFCENFAVYAWPTEYRKTTSWPVVGIGSFGNTYVVCTRGKPYFATGADSASLDFQQQDSEQACVSRKSIVNVEGGVVYASPDGLCMASPSGVKLFTESLWTREDWQALTPSTIFATEYHGAYVFHCTGGCFALNLADLTLRKIDATGSAFFRDMISDTLYLASGTTIKALFSEATKRTATWKSKKATSQRHENWGWAQVFGDASVTLKVYRDGTLTDTKTIANTTPVRLSSKRALEHEIQIESAGRVTAVICANTSDELRAL